MGKVWMKTREKRGKWLEKRQAVGKGIKQYLDHENIEIKREFAVRKRRIWGWMNQRRESPPPTSSPHLPPSH
jgi:hypothetical protein